MLLSMGSQRVRHDWVTSLSFPLSSSGISFLFLICCVFLSQESVKSHQMHFLQILKWSYNFCHEIYWYGEWHWFLDVKLSLHSWDKSHLVIVYNLFIWIHFVGISLRIFPTGIYVQGDGVLSLQYSQSLEQGQVQWVPTESQEMNEKNESIKHRISRAWRLLIEIVTIVWLQMSEYALSLQITEAVETMKNQNLEWSPSHWVAWSISQEYLTWGPRLGLGGAKASGNLFQNHSSMGSPFSSKGNMARTQGGGICPGAPKSIYKADEGVCSGQWGLIHCGPGGHFWMLWQPSLSLLTDLALTQLLSRFLNSSWAQGWHVG